MGRLPANQYRVFKSAWFAKAARKVRISDTELCNAIKQVVSGQCDDLGGGFFKKRLNKNRYRSIILSKAGSHWIFEYVFAKSDRANIDDSELEQFRKLAKTYATLTVVQTMDLLEQGDLVEICDEN